MKRGFKVSISIPERQELVELDEPVELQEEYRAENKIFLSKTEMIEILEKLNKSCNVTAYRIWGPDLSGVSEEVLVSMVLQSTELRISRCNLSRIQLCAISNNIQKSKLEELEVKEMNLKYIPLQENIAEVESSNKNLNNFSVSAFLIKGNLEM